MNYFLTYRMSFCCTSLNFLNVRRTIMTEQGLRLLVIKDLKNRREKVTFVIVTIKVSRLHCKYFDYCLFKKDTKKVSRLHHCALEFDFNVRIFRIIKDLKCEKEKVIFVIVTKKVSWLHCKYFDYCLITKDTKKFQDCTVHCNLI